MEKKCKSKIEFGDDFGDNSTTFHCQLKEGHKGKHQEKALLYKDKYTLVWEKLLTDK